MIENNVSKFTVATNGDNAPEIVPFDVVYYDEYAEADAGDVVVYYDGENADKIGRVKARTAEGMLLELSNGEKIGTSDVCGVVNEVRRVYGMASYILNASAKWLNGYCERHKSDGITFDEAFIALRGMLGALTTDE